MWNDTNAQETINQSAPVTYTVQQQSELNMAAKKIYAEVTSKNSTNKKNDNKKYSQMPMKRSAYKRQFARLIKSHRTIRQIAIKR